MAQVIQGDAQEEMKKMEAESVHCCITSIPYWGLRDYKLPPQVWDDPGGCEHVWQPSIEPGGQGSGESFRRDRKAGRKRGGHQPGFCRKCSAWRGSLGLEPTLEMYIQHMVEIFQEVWRVLRKEGTLWLVIGDSYWGGKGQSGHGYSKDHPDRETLQRDHTMPMGSKETRPQDGKHDVLKPKDLCGIPWRLAMAMQADGWYWRRWIPWIKPNAMPGSERDRPPGSGSTTEVILMLAKSQKNYYDPYAIYDDKLYRDSHFFDESLELLAMRVKTTGFLGERCQFCKSYYPRGWSGLPRHIDEDGKKHAICSTCGKWNEWLSHYATFPENLVVPIIKLSTSEKGCCPECGAPWERMIEKLGSPNVIRTLGWRPGCVCRAPGGFRPDDLEIINSPLGKGIGNDPSMKIGRAGYGRPRRHGEGKRPITRYEQRRYAEQLGQSPHREEMESEAGKAFAHYIRTDRIGARPLPDNLLTIWLNRGWLQKVEVPHWTPTTPVPCIVLDPFAGSGTVSKVAQDLVRDAIAIELNPDYCEIIRHRTVCGQEELRLVRA